LTPPLCIDEIDPNYPDANGELGNILFQRGDLKEAVAHWQKALRIQPDDSNVLLTDRFVTALRP
jgi:Flp pilus assembly protein TadD